MTIFNGAIAAKSIEDWDDLAKESVESSGGHPGLLGILGLGAGVLLAGLSPIAVLGLIPAAWGIKKAMEVNDRRSRMDAALDMGAYAAVLPQQALREYAQQFGMEQAIAQIDWAKRAGVPLSEAAETLLGRYKQKYKALPPALEPIAALEAQAIGTATQLGAVDVAAVEVEDSPVDEWWNSSPATAPQSVQTDGDSWGGASVAIAVAHPVSYLIGDRLRTSLIVSVSGGGKDILLSNALREFLSKHRGFKVIVMDCKDDAKETGYYAGLPNVRLHRLNVAIASDGEIAEWVDRCLEEFLQLPEKALLICNEATLIRAKSKRYVDVINGLVSSGDSREKYCWEAGQSAHLLDLCINGAARSRLRLLIIGLKGEEQQISAVLRAQCVDDTARSMSDIKGQLMRSPVGRAWCDGMRWFPMPELENHSGYNRDKRSPIAPTTPKKMTTAETREALEKSFHSPETFPDEGGKSPETTGNISGHGGNFPEPPEMFPRVSGIGGNRETQWEKEFPGSEDDGKHFPETFPETPGNEFPLVKAVYLAVKAEMETGKSRTEIVQTLLECKGRKYKAGCAWFDALLQKFEPQ